MITNQTVRAVDSGNGVTTSFNYGFLIPETSSMVLTYIDSLGVETTVSTAGLTISGIGTTSGGSVGYAPGGTPIDTGSLFVIERASPYTQEASYTNQDGYYPATTEEALDWLAYQTQQLKDKVSRALMVSVGNQLALNTLPIESARAGYAVGFDSTGQIALLATAGIGDVVSTYWAGVLQTTNSSTAQTALGATTVGAAVFTATTATAARSTLSLTNAFISTSVKVFTTGGTYTASANMVYAVVEAVGGGGGGGGGSGATTGGGGGGAGAYGRKLITAGITSATITIGTGGAGGTSTNAGSTGGSTTMSGVITCVGGGGGAAGNGTNGALGGAGGSAPTADVAIAGGDGVSVGASPGSVGGTGAASYFGGGGRGSSVVTAPSAGVAKGSGGGGSYGGGTGANGANGVVIITEFIKVN